ncbi:MAG: RNA polymerase sigma factor [Rhodopseudomonas palustris]|nr:RNA polymerase sigma factor [Rhodopseudomonas palustris]
MQALRWWKEGKLLEIAEYCCFDVKITKDVHEFGRAKGEVFLHRPPRPEKVRQDQVVNPLDADAELMLRVRRGDRAAFRELVERHQRGVIQTIYRAIGDAWEAEDLAQRVFVQVWRSAARYKPTAKFTTWLFAIVHNIILNERRRAPGRGAESLEALSRPDEESANRRAQFADAASPDPVRAAAERELQAHISTAIRGLPDNQRTAVVLCRFEGFSYEEIAKVLRCSVPAVKSLLHRRVKRSRSNYGVVTDETFLQNRC